uniref:Uncharacterized protein n=1 Tax=Rhodnius prolixus TaxID=13249 RepID=T1I613_RHOPR
MLLGFQMLPDVDSDGEPTDELYSLGLNYENLPPEFRRSYDELSEDEKAYRDLTTKWIRESRENREKARACEILRKTTNQSEVRDLSKNCNEILREIKNNCDSILNMAEKSKQLVDELNKMLASSGISPQEQQKMINALKLQKKKLERSLTVITARKQAKPKPAKKVMPINPLLKNKKPITKEASKENDNK